MVVEIEQAALFDYASLDSDTREFVQEKAQAIHARLKRTAEDIIAIGQDLTEVNEKLAPHGKFHNWLRCEFDMSRQTAYRFMSVSKKFGSCNIMLQHSPTALYSLLDVSDTIIEQVESGQIEPTLSAIREAKQEMGAIHLVAHPIETGYEFKKDVYTSPGATSQPIQAPYTPPDATSQLLQGTQVAKEAYEAAIEDRPLIIADIPPTTTVLDAKDKRDAHVMQVMGSSESPEWYTPQEIVRLSIELLGEIDLDPCSNSHETPNIPAHTRYTKEDDGLAHEWQGRVYLNPPYGNEIPQWIEKLVQSYGHGVTEAIALLPARIDTLWFQPLYDFPMCNIRGRLQFENASNSAPFPSIVVYLGERIDDFIRVFNHRGPIMRRIG